MRQSFCSLLEVENETELNARELKLNKFILKIKCMHFIIKKAIEQLN